MRSTLEALVRDIEEISVMASAIKPATNLLAKSKDPAVRTYLSVRRRFDYSAVVVALYASLERFVEDILKSYAEISAKYSSYEALPSALTIKHLQKSAELLTRGSIDQNRYPGVTQVQLVKNLFECLSGNSSYGLNLVAVSAHETNIRYDELHSLLNVVGISHDGVRRADPLVDWYYAEQEMRGERPDAVPERVVKQRLDDLVERRNDVAHRGGNPDQRLGGEEMQVLVEFVLALSRSIFTLFVSHYLRKHHAGGSVSERLQLERGPFRRKTVWEVKPPASRLHLSQPVFALSQNFLARWGRIENLQVKGLDKASVEPGNVQPVGIQFDFSFSKNSEVYILNSEDEIVWSALS